MEGSSLEKRRREDSASSDDTLSRMIKGGVYPFAVNKKGIKRWKLPEVVNWGNVQICAFYALRSRSSTAL
jgi:hypothetical protein